MPDLLDIVGQDSALVQLQRAVASGRRSHANLFAGPEGVGRRTTAVEFAKLLLCENPLVRPNSGRFASLDDDFELRSACGQCPSCLTVRSGTNPDFQLVYKELARFHDDPDVRGRVMQNLGIDVIRQFLIDPAYRAAAGGRGKVFVVLQAEMMSPAAQNALLKTLEEPPAGVTIILICTSAARLLPTTRSRCRLVRFGPLPLDFTAESLIKEGVKPDEAHFWAAMTGGAIGPAKRRADEKLYEFKKTLLERLSTLPDSPGANLTEMLVKTTEKISRKLVRRDEKLSKTLAGRQAGQTILDIIVSIYRDALSLACRTGGNLVHADQAGKIEKIAARFGPEATAEILTQLARCEQLLWRNANAKLLWDNVSITCASAAALEV